MLTLILLAVELEVGGDWASYLASGQDISNVALAYRVGVETAWRRIHVTCRANWAFLKGHFMKGTFSIVLMAVVDSSSKFVLIDVGRRAARVTAEFSRTQSLGRSLSKGSLTSPHLGSSQAPQRLRRTLSSGMKRSSCGATLRALSQLNSMKTNEESSITD
ncbi:hypothetical protein HPB48_018115 [Haemaphysalis longicornis]|uniref:Secreted protein n=1 Tax=Haemaphysalis longicornis TaxID=44386 RepID=A0A9J6GXK0_HAELO|nr:hypothetical protein HPB48_018115 [Haemaphysalis longicornis]